MLFAENMALPLDTPYSRCIFPHQQQFRVCSFAIPDYGTKYNATGILLEKQQFLCPDRHLCKNVECQVICHLSYTVLRSKDNLLLHFRRKPCKIIAISPYSYNKIAVLLRIFTRLFEQLPIRYINLKLKAPQAHI